MPFFVSPQNFAFPASFSMTYFDYFSIFSSLSYQENIVIKRKKNSKKWENEAKMFLVKEISKWTLEVKNDM